MAYSLKIGDNVEEVDFMGASFKVDDGGFDISLPRVKRELAPLRPGFYVPTMSYYEYRECRIKFQIHGATRSAVVANIHKIERILRNVAARQRLASGRRGQLTYKWDGTSNTTYFEIYSGDFTFPQDVLSVEKQHRFQDGEYILNDCEVVLNLSATGYGVSMYSDTLTEVPLYNPSVGAKQTGGVAIKNPGYGQYNYVEIAGTDLPGSQPLLTRIQLASSSPYTAWNLLYMGLQATPFPSYLVFDSHLFDGTDRLKSASGWASNVNANANTCPVHTSSTVYRSKTFTSNYYDTFSSLGWSVTNDVVGMFYSFFHAFDAIPAGIQLAVGVDDYTEWGIRYLEDWVAPNTGLRTVPLGAIQLPPTGLALADKGTLKDSLWLGVWVANGSASSQELTVDYLSMLPIGGGMRMWRARNTSALTGTMIDDGWKGLEYLLSGSNVYSPFYGLMEPLQLEPGITQRIYFMSIGSQAPPAERQRTFVARVYTVPTYLSLAT